MAVNALKKGARLSIRVDSYVFESNVHFPTDLNLAWDCARKCIVLSTRLSKAYALTGWGKHINWQRKLKGLYRNGRTICLVNEGERASVVRQRRVALICQFTISSVPAN